MTGTVRAYVGLGANVGDPRATLERAVASLASLPEARLAAVSRLYRTKPVGVLDQPDFLNAVVAIDLPAADDPTAGAIDLLVALKGLERESGRRRRRRWGPRELDLDLLLYGNQRIVTARPPAASPATAAPPEASPTSAAMASSARLLEVPHPSAGDRLFVLAPLAEIAPDLVPPGWRETIEAARARRLAEDGADAAVPVGTWAADEGGWRSR